MRKRTCYIAGPMRSRPGFNYPAFFAAERALRTAGWRTHNPARKDGAPTNLTIDQQRKHAEDPENARRVVKKDLRAIWSLRVEHGDAVVVLPGWTESVGARAEVAVARWLGLPVIYLREALTS